MGSYLTLGNELSKETHVLTEGKGHLKRLLQWRTSRSGNSGGLLCLAARSLRVYQVRLVSRLSAASHLALPIFDLTQGPSWGRMPLSVRIGSSTRDSGRLAGHIMGYRLLALLAPSQILPVGFVGGSSVLCSLLGPQVARHLI